MGGRASPHGRAIMIWEVVGCARLEAAVTISLPNHRDSVPESGGRQRTDPVELPLRSAEIVNPTRVQGPLRGNGCARSSTYR